MTLVLQAATPAGGNGGTGAVSVPVASTINSLSSPVSAAAAATAIDRRLLFQVLQVLELSSYRDAVAAKLRTQRQVDVSSIADLLTHTDVGMGQADALIVEDYCADWLEGRVAVSGFTSPAVSAV